MTMENGFLGVNYPHLTGVLVQAIKEQQLTIDEMKNQMMNQQEQIDNILKMIKNNNNF